MRKRIVTTLFSSLLAVPLAVAQTLPAPPVTQQQVTNALSGLLVGSVINQADVYARLLLVIVLTLVLVKPAEKLAGGDRKIAFIVALLVSLLGVRFLGNAEILGLILPYTALAIILSVGIPLALIVSFVTTSDLPESVRKFVWFLVALIFTTLWWIRWTDIGDLAYVYLIGTIAAVTMYLKFDNMLSKMWYENQLKEDQEVSKSLAAEVISNEIKELYKQINLATGSSRRRMKKTIARKQKDIKELFK